MPSQRNFSVDFGDADMIDNFTAYFSNTIFISGMQYHTSRDLGESETFNLVANSQRRL